MEERIEADMEERKIDRAYDNVRRSFFFGLIQTRAHFACKDLIPSNDIKNYLFLESKQFFNVNVHCVMLSY